MKPMMFATAIVTLAFLAACSSTLESTPVATDSTNTSSNFVGLLEVQVSGIGEGGTPTSSARFVDPASLTPDLNAKAVEVVPVNGSSALNDVQFIPKLKDSFDETSTSMRYISNSFELVNRKTTNFNNFTLYAVSIPGTTVGGTALANIRTAGGTLITSESIARSFKPTHGMRKNGFSLAEINPNSADLQLFTPTEVNNPTNGVQQKAIVNGVVPGNSTVLEYGFVARNKGDLSSRTIAPRNTASDCTANTCKGVVTLAYKLPVLNPGASSPVSFRMYFVVANETNAIISQSLEEQSAGTVAGRSSVTAFDQVRTLVGSGYGLNAINLNPLCRVRTATGSMADSFLGAVPAPVAGGLDACFGTGGKRALPGTRIPYNTLGIQSDGKIVVALTETTPSNRIWLERYNTNGSFDTSFDGDGRVRTQFGSGSAAVFALGIQGDGKIVVAADSSNGSNNSAIVLLRYNTDGSLDTSFDGDGIVTTDIGTSNDRAEALAIQSDGKIVVAGRTQTGLTNDSDFALVRYNTDGSLDTSFDTDGIVTTAIGSSDDSAYSLAIQTDGKIVAAGTSRNDSNADFALVRYNANGSLDTSFDGDGIVTTAIGSAYYSANAMRIQGDGKIVVTGITYNGTNYDFALVRYNTNGSLDTSFDGDGIVTTAIGSGEDIANALAIQSDGKIVVAGYTSGAGRDFALVRYNTNGSLDTSFDGDGKVITAIGSGNDSDYATAVAIQGDGKILVAGFGYPAYGLALARYNP
jgi:uncharacterized delta-60 repeat protein